jgi:hypothetical protein
LPFRDALASVALPAAVHALLSKLLLQQADKPLDVALALYQRVLQADEEAAVATAATAAKEKAKPKAGNSKIGGGDRDGSQCTADQVLAALQGIALQKIRFDADFVRSVSLARNLSLFERIL